MSDQTVMLCWRTGGDFHFPDVDLLAYHIRKQYKGQGTVKIYCITDIVSREIVLKNVILIPAENNQWFGWWVKMNMFSPSMDKYRPFLYFDLDTAIVGDLSGFLPPVGYENEFICLNSFFDPPRKNELQSGVMWFGKNNNDISLIWEAWKRDPQAVVRRFHTNGGDQAFFKSVITMTKVDWQGIQPNKVWSFKFNPTKKEWLTDLPTFLSVVCFHGKPRIPVAGRTVGWVQEYIKEAKNYE